MQDGLNGIYEKIWKTKGSRYQAYNRLRAQYRFSQFGISIISLYIVALSIIPMYFTLDDLTNKVLQILTVVSSIFIIILSLLENSKSYELKADILHRSANEMSAIFNKFQFLVRQKTVTDADALATIQSYDSIIKNCVFNHEDIDYDLFRLCDPKIFELKPYDIIFLHIKCFVINYGLFVALILMPPVTIAVILYFYKI